MYRAQTIALPVRQEGEGIDNYSAKGVWLSRDAASVVMAALHRDAYEMRQRGGSANLDGAMTNDGLADAILEALR